QRHLYSYGRSLSWRAVDDQVPPEAGRSTLEIPKALSTGGDGREVEPRAVIVDLQESQAVLRLQRDPARRRRCVATDVGQSFANELHDIQRPLGELRRDPLIHID